MKKTSNKEKDTTTTSSSSAADVFSNEFKKRVATEQAQPEHIKHAKGVSDAKPATLFDDDDDEEYVDFSQYEKYDNDLPDKVGNFAFILEIKLRGGEDVIRGSNDLKKVGLILLGDGWKPYSKFLKGGDPEGGLESWYQKGNGLCFQQGLKNHRFIVTFFSDKKLAGKYNIKPQMYHEGGWIFVKGHTTLKSSVLSTSADDRLIAHFEQNIRDVVEDASNNKTPLHLNIKTIRLPAAAFALYGDMMRDVTEGMDLFRQAKKAESSETTPVKTGAFRGAAAPVSSYTVSSNSAFTERK